ncbi:MAG: ADP-ribosylation factor-like protein [Promethearchaeota archaeon]
MSKIAILGLENAGKTSIVELFKRKKVDFENLAPTKGVSREDARILNKMMKIHDFGGQRVYREKYLESDMLFLATDILCFVVDIQDSPRFDETIKYFGDILGLISRLDGLPKIFILLHKFDNEFLEQYMIPHSRFKKSIEGLISGLKEKASENGIDIANLFLTSIYNEWSCFKAFHEILRHIAVRLKNIDQFLADLIGEFDEVPCAIIVDDKGTLLANTPGINSTHAYMLIKGFLDHEGEILELDKKSNHSIEVQVDNGCILVRKLDLADNLGKFIIVLLKKDCDLTHIQETITKRTFTLAVFLSITKNVNS